MANVRLRILGECVIEIGKRELEPDAPHLFAMSLFLAVECGRSVPRAELLDLLFSEAPDARTASHNLRQLLYRLRRLGAPLVLDKQAVYVDPAHVTNVADEITRCDYADRLRRLGASCVVLPHYAATQSAPLAAWVDGLRDRVHTALRRQLCADLDVARRRADWRSLELIARRALQVDPLNESATLALAEAAARTGSKALAVSILEAYEREVGGSRAPLALPAQLLRKRIGNGTHAAATQSATPVPLLGRAEEMAELLSAWARARDGHFGTLAVTGEKSVGKTRLTDEFAAVVEMEGSGSVVAVRPTPADRERPLALFADLVKQLLVLPGAAGCDPDALPYLRRLSGASALIGPITGEPSQARLEDAALRRAVGDLIASVSEERPLLCWVDSADELDPASHEMLGALQKGLPASRVLFVLCGSRSLSGWTELRLAPLQSAAARGLLDTLMERTGTSIGDQEAAWCLAVAAGNPGHLELLLRQAARAWDPQAIPPDLIALADQRIAELSTEAQYALQAMAVIGDAATSESVAELTGLGPYQLLTALHELDGASLVARGIDGLRCRTAFIADRAIRMASPVALAVMHDRAAMLLEQQYAQRTLSQGIVWRIATHWKLAGRATRAREFLRGCWLQAVDIGQPMVAVTAIHRTLEHAESPEEQAELLDDLIGALQAAGAMHELSQAVADRTLLSACVADSDARRASLSFDGVEARVHGQDNPAQHIDVLRGHLDSPLLDTRRRLRAARLLMIAADIAIDEGLAAETMTVGRNIATTDPMAQLLQYHLALIYHTVFGAREEALRIARHVDRLVEGSERSWYKFVSRRNCSIARQLAGDGTPEYQEMERLYYDCLEASMTTDALNTASYLATLLIDDERPDDAAQWLRRAEAAVASLGDDTVPLDYLTAQVDLALITGECKRARAFVAHMETNAARFDSGRLGDDLLLYRIRVAQFCGGPLPTDAELTQLLRYHYTARRFGRHDDHMDVLWVALNAAGRSEEASRLLAEYLTRHRRERRSCRYLLRTRTKHDPAWR
jgi:DNA-binding SARP family transcriptional activator